MSERLAKKSKKDMENDIKGDTEKDGLNLEVPALYIINGMMKSGKSYLIDYMMYKLRKKFKYGIVFTNTFFDDKPFPYINVKYIHPDFSEEALDNLMDMQAKKVAKGIIHESFVIFDDMLDDPGQFTSPSLRRLSTQLRHYHITLIMSTQYTNLLPARIRTNAMGVFIFNTDSEIALKTLYESYGQRFPKFEYFKKYIFDNLNEKYKFIYYDKSTTETELKDIYQVMMCPAKIPPFKIKF